MCRNVEWMLCAVHGRLATRYKDSRSPAPAKGGEIEFSLAPKDMEMAPFDENTLPRCCGDYAEDDIYYLEVCVLNEVCANSDEMWTIDVGVPWTCQLSDERYRGLQQVLQGLE